MSDLPAVAATVGWEGLDFFSYRMLRDPVAREVLWWAGLIAPEWTQVEVRLAALADAITDGLGAPVAVLASDVPSVLFERAMLTAFESAGVDASFTPLFKRVFKKLKRLSARRNEYAHRAWAYYSQDHPHDLLLFRKSEVVRMKSTLTDRVAGKPELVPPRPRGGLVVTLDSVKHDFRAFENAAGAVLCFAKMLRGGSETETAQRSLHAALDA